MPSSTPSNPEAPTGEPWGDGGPKPDSGVSRGTTPPILASVVLDYSRADLTEGCVRAVRRQSDCPIVIVENGIPASRRYAGIPGVTVVHNARNLGFAGGVNVGLRRTLAALPAFVLVLNNDARPGPGAIDGLLEAVRANPAFDVVAPEPRRVDGDHRDAPPGRIRFWQGPRHSEEGDPTTPSRPGAPIIREVPRTSGYCLLIRRA
ncbi:MAG: glycosyltransferase, partial [Thermoplasmata archaeon]|nr:glycosyltransferase [Thermoplasmata archaeon]